jgi:hypothetical protein
MFVYLRAEVIVICPSYDAIVAFAMSDAVKLKHNNENCSVRTNRRIVLAVDPLPASGLRVETKV